MQPEDAGMVRAGSLMIPGGDPYFARVFAQSGDRFDFESLRALMRAAGSRRTCAVDVGAHVGSWTRYFAQHFETVLAFEPNPENFRCLRANAPADVFTIPCALGAGEERMGLARHGTNSGCWHLTDGDGVQVRSLDSFDLEACDVLKIDVEGYEGAVVQGAHETILAHRPAILIECNGLAERHYGQRIPDAQRLLRELGYRLVDQVNKDQVWTM